MAQQILAYITLAIALGYLVWKFILPKTLFSRTKQHTKECGQDNCECN